MNKQFQKLYFRKLLETLAKETLISINFQKSFCGVDTPAAKNFPNIISGKMNFGE